MLFLKKIFLFLITCGIISLHCTLFPTQQETQGGSGSETIIGRVVYRDGSPAPGCRISVYKPILSVDSEISLLKTTISDNKGDYSFSSLDSTESYDVVGAAPDNQHKFCASNVKPSPVMIIDTLVLPDSATFTYWIHKDSLNKTIYDSASFCFSKIGCPALDSSIIPLLKSLRDTTYSIVIQKFFPDSSKRYILLLSEKEVHDQIVGIIRNLRGYWIDSLQIPAKVTFSSDYQTTLWQPYAIPNGIAVDEAKNRIYISDERSDYIRIYTLKGDYLGEWINDFEDPAGIAIHNNSVFVCDKYQDLIRKFDLGGILLSSFGGIGDGNGKFNNCLEDVAIDTLGNLYATEGNCWGNSSKNYAQKLDSNGQFITNIGENIIPQRQNAWRGGIAFDNYNKMVLIA